MRADQMNLGQCDSCQAENVPIKPYSRPRGFDFQTDRGSDDFCDLCAATVAGNAYQYPEQYQESRDILRTLCYVGNEILKAIKSPARHRIEGGLNEAGKHFLGGGQ